MDFIGDMFSELGSFILEKLNEFVGMLMFWLSAGIIKLLQICEKLFDVFSGTTKIRYQNTPEFLVNVFFKNSSINNVYWAMALLGIVFVVAFTIVAVTRKSFDMNDSQKQTMGGILGSMFKSILTILVLSMVMSGALSITNQLVVTLGDVFNNADSFNHGGPIVYTNEDYATMARIYKTIGNYSLNPSYSSRYNMNSCFNDIRSDLLILEERGIFDEVYPEPGQEGDDAAVPVTWNWQSVLEKIVYSTDLKREVRIDSENADLFQALELAMNQIRTNSAFYPIDHFRQEYSVNGESVSLANVIFLSGTATAAKNSNYNRDPYITDGLRGAYYRGQKDITSYETVKKDFNTSLTGINYIMILVLAFFTIKSLFHCIVACISRMINMAGLYIIAPLAISTMPMDEGAKFKQWTTSMIVQMLGVFGYIIPMRLLILFVPIMMGSDLVLFDGVIMNFLAKAFLIVGSVLAIQEFSGIINGILADMAGHAALDSGKSVQRAASGLSGAVGSAGGALTKGLGKYVAAPVLGATFGAVGAGVVGGFQWAGGKIKQGYNWAKDKATGRSTPKGAPANLKSAPGGAGGNASGGDSSGGDSSGGALGGGQPTNYQGSADSDKQSQSEQSQPGDSGIQQPGSNGVGQQTSSQGGSDHGVNPINYGAMASGSGYEGDSNSGVSDQSGSLSQPGNYSQADLNNPSDPAVQPSNYSQQGTSSNSSSVVQPSNYAQQGMSSNSSPVVQPGNYSQQGVGSHSSSVVQPSNNVQQGTGSQPGPQSKAPAPGQFGSSQAAPSKNPPPIKNYNNQQ